MKRAALLTMAIGLLVSAPPWAWAGEPDAAAEDGADRYAVPEGDIAQLVKFLDSLSQFRPGTIEEDIEHRTKFRKALKQAAQRIVQLESDPTSPASQAATFLLLADRVRSIAQGDPQQQRQTAADVKAYLTERIKKGQAGAAAHLATSTAENLEHTGQYEFAADVYKSFAQVLADSENEQLSEMAAKMKASAEQLLAKSKEMPKPPEIEILPKGVLVCLDLQPKCNQKITDLSGPGDFEGNGLAELPRGEETFCRVKFRILDKLIQLAGTNLPDAPEKAEGIPVNEKATRLYVLHAAQWSAPDSTVIGQFTLHYEGGSTASMPIVYGEDVRDWWASDGGTPVTRGRVVWTGSNVVTDPRNVALRLYLSVWENPHPDKKIASLDYVSSKTACAPFCVAISVERPAD
jgi:hypothetical protein